MRKVFLAAALVVCLAALAMAQNKDNYEVFGGFSIDSINTGLANSGLTGGQHRDTGLGFEGSQPDSFGRIWESKETLTATSKRKRLPFSPPVRRSTPLCPLTTLWVAHTIGSLPQAKLHLSFMRSWEAIIQASVIQYSAPAGETARPILQ